jgi:glycerol-3-phosphate dehydrogenase
VWTYSGVRPLYDDGASEAKAATRDYVFEFDDSGGAPVLSIFGGKITTYRRLAEEALERLEAALPEAVSRAGWTATAPLPGGDFPTTGFAALADDLLRDFPWLARRHALRLAGAYGAQARAMLAGAQAMDDLGRAFGASLTEREVRHLIDLEWAQSADDIVWRRSKLGLRMTPAEIAALDDWIASYRRDAARTANTAAGGA